VCGIAGVLDPAGVERDSIERQLRLLDHRGPDAWGTFGGGAGAIGQTRLSVIDLATGDPPITNEDGSIGVALNGEIYNYGELREELRAGGHRLATEGDTEVIAHLAEALDPIALARRLHGMFAFAVWDPARERLVLGRDRLGKKPLYYWASGGRLVFASEIKAVLADPRVPRRLDESVIPTYLAFGYAPTPRTFFQGVRSVPPGHVLVAEHGEVRLEPYWQPPLPLPGGEPGLDVSLEEGAAAVRAGLTAAVRRRLVGDVPVGAFLSGGIDSTVVVGLMAELSPQPVRTFTIGFDDREGFDERPYARIAARRFGTHHEELVVAPDAAGLLERLVWSYDQPFGDSSAIPTFLLAELTSGHVKVALSGDGGDELFAGYARFAAGLAADRWTRPLAAAGPPLARALARLPSSRARLATAAARRFLERAGGGLPGAYLDWLAFVAPEQRVRLLAEGDRRALAEHRDAWERSEGADPLDRLLHLNLSTYLVDDLLPKVDRMSMAHALEVRSPFLDHELVELALRLPRELRIHGFTRKRVLRAATADLVPAELRRRRKRGFGVPLARWFRSDLSALLDGSLGAADARVRGLLAGDAVDALIREHRRGGADHGHALWTLLTLETFLRREGW
jgi:asparagine synthase (glutamine-hydrolysing)